MNSFIVVIAEHADGQIRPITYELVACARRLQHLQPADIRIVVLSDPVETLAETLSQKTGLPVDAIRVPHLTEYHGDVYRSVLSEFFKDLQPRYVCTAHTSQGLDFTPGLAMRLGAACITGVEAITEINGDIFCTRRVCGGKLVADMVTDHPQRVLSILPGSFSADASEAVEPGAVSCRTAAPTAPVRSISRGILRSSVKASGIMEADVIVAAGRGVGDKDNLELIFRLAALFSGSAVAGSRIVCDMGWLDYAQQVGVTGFTVQPSLYIACGISGAIQHVSGMKSSGFIVAINSDPNAAIFNISDVCIVEDMLTFIPLFIEAAHHQ